MCIQVCTCVCSRCSRFALVQLHVRVPAAVAAVTHAPTPQKNKNKNASSPLHPPPFSTVHSLHPSVTTCCIYPSSATLMLPSSAHPHPHPHSTRSSLLTSHPTTITTTTTTTTPPARPALSHRISSIRKPSTSFRPKRHARCC